MSKVDLRVDWCSYEAAKYAVMHWHYSKSMPVGKMVKLGVWEAENFRGSVVFACGSSGVGSIGKSMGLLSFEVAELARVALQEHWHPVTRILSIALKMLRRSQPGLRLVVSYADPEQNHIGAIYQAGNWVYTGRSAKDTAYIDRTGKRWHSRSVSESGIKVHCGKPTKCPRPSEMVRQIDVPRKYRYFMPLDRAMRRQIEPLAQPYPKRAGEAKTANAPGVQPGNRGFESHPSALETEQPPQPPPTGDG